MSLENNFLSQITNISKIPKFGLVTEFCDDQGPGMLIGKGDEAFIVRPHSPGFCTVSAPLTSPAGQKALELMEEVIKGREKKS